MTNKIHIVFSTAMSLIVVVAVVWGVVLAGSPAAARRQKFDQQRLQDLQTIFDEIQSLCRHPEKDELRNPLPQTLDELARRARSRRIQLTDPETGERYQYVLKDRTTYELCATFTLQRNSDTEVFWNHPIGPHCYTINALDPP